MDEVLAPQDVRIVPDRGTSIPVTCRYDGVIADLHTWTAKVPSSFAQRLTGGFRITVAVLPARTCLRVEFDAE